MHIFYILCTSPPLVPHKPPTNTPLNKTFNHINPIRNRGTSLIPQISPRPNLLIQDLNTHRIQSCALRNLHPFSKPAPAQTQHIAIAVQFIAVHNKSICIIYCGYTPTCINPLPIHNIQTYKNASQYTKYPCSDMKFFYTRRRHTDITPTPIKIFTYQLDVSRIDLHVWFVMLMVER